MIEAAKPLVTNTYVWKSFKPSVIFWADVASTQEIQKSDNNYIKAILTIKLNK